jgi:hypothetical protein
LCLKHVHKRFEKSNSKFVDRDIDRVDFHTHRRDSNTMNSLQLINHMRVDESTDKIYCFIAHSIRSCLIFRWVEYIEKRIDTHRRDSSTKKSLRFINHMRIDRVNKLSTLFIFISFVLSWLFDEQMNTLKINLILDKLSVFIRSLIIHFRRKWMIE